jgi:hypothetical protein
VVAVAPDQRDELAVADGHVVGIDRPAGDVVAVRLRGIRGPGVVAEQAGGVEAGIILPNVLVTGGRSYGGRQPAAAHREKQ